MGRRNRKNILYDGCYAHVFSRAADKRYIFNGTQDFEKFKTLLAESKRRFSYRIHHYCLMHTHFHLAVSMDHAEAFSEGLKGVKWSYARYFNLRNQRFGPLWRDRFKSLLIEDERYLQACGRYIEGNPVEAGIVKRCEDWPYSSSRHYLEGKEDALVDSYTFDGEPITIKGDPEKTFTQGQVIGSDLFKIHFEEESILPVPR
jgi:putative transposase